MAGRHFTRAPADVMHRIRDLAARYHQQDMHIGHEGDEKLILVTVEAFFVYGPTNKDGEQTGPAISVRGSSAYACIRPTSLEERVAGRADVVIHIDADQWPSLATDVQDAILDHELEHVELKRDKKNNAPMFDDNNRPLITMRPHDMEFGWFNSVARRHGRSSMEVIQAERFTEPEMVQMYFPGFSMEMEKPAAKPRIAHKTKTTVRVDDADADVLIPKRKRKAAASHA